MSALTFTVLVGTSLLGAVSGIIGSFAVLRRRALLGDVLAHAALPGICVAYLVMQERRLAGLLVGGLAAGILGLLIVAVIHRFSRTKEDAAIGLVLSTFFGAGTVLLSWIQRRPGAGSQSGLASYIYGQAATITWDDVRLLALVAFGALAVVVLLYKEFKLLSFDPEFAQAQGWPVLWLDLTMMTTLAVVTVVGLPAVGVVLMAAMLIVPGATARLWSERLGRMLLLAALFGLLAGGMGTAVSAGLVVLPGFDTTTSLPTGPAIVLASAALFLISLLFAPRRGLIARAIAMLRMRRKIARQHLLRSLYEWCEPSLPERRVFQSAEVQAARGWSRPMTALRLAAARAGGWIESYDSGYRLTQTGLEAAARITRAHRLWEHFLIASAQADPAHADRAADALEHYLSGTLVEELEARLADVPEGAEHGVPRSPHAVGPPETTRV